MSIEQNPRVKLYACGGAACNIGKLTEGFRHSNVSGFSSLDIVYIDTSDSDFDGLPEEHIYKIKEKDGSGGLRKHNAQAIAKYVQEILQTHKPLNLNIVLSSASGGSGSVTSPTITNELLKKGENVIVILVGAVDTRLYINNTLNTLKSYENISRTNQKSLVLKYLQNPSSSKHKEVDEEVKFTISALCMLFSGQNKSLDSQDLRHWINFDKVTTFDSQMVSLETVKSLDMLKAQGNIVSVASIAPKDGNTDLEQKVEVQFIGYVPDEMPEESKQSLPIHFVTTDGLIDELHSRLTEDLAELNNVSQARVKRDSIITEDDEPTENGIIL